MGLDLITLGDSVVDLIVKWSIHSPKREGLRLRLLNPLSVILVEGEG